MTTPDITIVIPAYREAATLRDNLRVIHDAVAPLGRCEIVVVDDGSPDGTWSVLRSLADEMDGLRAVRLSRRFGKESAVGAGLSEARGDAVIVMDADLEHPPTLIAEMMDLRMRGGYEVVRAVKSRRQSEPTLKRVLTHGYFRLFSTLSGMDMDNATDFMLLDRKVVDTLNALPENGRFFRGLVGWVGFRQITLQFEVPDRSTRHSRWTTRGLFSLAIDSILSFSSAPMHLMTFLGLLFGVVAIGIAARTLMLWFRGDAVEGFSTVILLLAMIGAFLMLGLGIIGAYIARIYDEVRARPRFIVSDRLVADLPDRSRNDRDRTDPRAEARESPPSPPPEAPR
ncbi:MAG: glycosyltransferase family 2 protein [Gammaproteobacteria bacterium]|jgi:glycosyltransferase involved in cell wall biosynthesis